MITWQDIDKALEMIKYYNTLSTEMYFKENKKERHHNLRVALMNKMPKPDFVKQFVKEKLEPLEIKQREDDDIKSADWIKEKWKNWQIIRYTDKYICLAKEEAWMNNEFKYKSQFIIKIKEKPYSAKNCIEFIKYTSDNPKYEKMYETERFKKFKKYIYDLELNYNYEKENI